MENKRWFQSKTIQGQIVAAVNVVVMLIESFVGVSLIGTAELTQLVSATTTVIGLTMGVVGRVRANTRITK